jgi:GT2 family glycosyltransferase
MIEDIIVLNNDSSQSYESVENFIKNNNHIPFKYINGSSNVGVARGRNMAAEIAKGNIMVFVDDDVVIEDKNILPKIIASFLPHTSNDREIGVSCFKVLYYSTGQMQQTAFPNKNFNKHKNDPNLLTSYYVGCAHAFKKKVWDLCGNYPEDFFYGMEEYDLSYRVLDKGYAIQYDASVVVLHKESPLGRKTKAEKQKMLWVNKSKVAWRFLPKQYFFSTAVLWSGEYLIKSHFNLKNFFSAVRQVARIPFSEKRTPISKNTLKYLRQINARLWY